MDNVGGQGHEGNARVETVAEHVAEANAAPAEDVEDDVESDPKGPRAFKTARRLFLFFGGGAVYGEPFKRPEEQFWS